MNSHPALEVRNLVRKFGDLLAVDRLSFQVHQGEILGLLGPNGAGKTTSIRMICGLLKPGSGEVIVHGKSLDSGGRAEIRSRVGICPQENILWTKLTCFEQLVFSARMYNVPGRIARVRADRFLREMGLESKRNSLAGKLSGGMKRRMNVIMAIMHDPDILVFDEPEAGLDPQSRILVRDFIRTNFREKTVIVTTHNMDEAERIADRVAIMDSGKLLLLDAPEKLKNSIGEGDILELKLAAPDAASLSTAEQNLSAAGYSVAGKDLNFLVKGLNLLPKIHEIYSILEKEEIQVHEMKIRENTLEDVFIHLTGKSLRT